MSTISNMVSNQMTPITHNLINNSNNTYHKLNYFDNYNDNSNGSASRLLYQRSSRAADNSKSLNGYFRNTDYRRSPIPWHYGTPLSRKQPPRRKSHFSKSPSSPSTSNDWTSIFDPFQLFSSRMGTNAKTPAPVTTPKPTDSAPLVFFPDGHEGECQDFSSPGFNTYSFVGFLLGVVNIVSQVSNNINNNLNNNNNNNNDNNNNLGNINAASSNANQNNANGVNIPGAIAGRRRRSKSTAPEEDRPVMNALNDLSSDIQDDIQKLLGQIQDQEVFDHELSLVTSTAILFLRCFHMLVSDTDGSCHLRTVCDANKRAVLDPQDTEGIAPAFADVFTSSLLEWAPIKYTEEEVLNAGHIGRLVTDCSSLSPKCSEELWNSLLFSQEIII